jgi:hypothetical protein
MMSLIAPAPPVIPVPKVSDGSLQDFFGRKKS